MPPPQPNPYIVHAGLIKTGSRNPAHYNSLITLYSKSPSTLSSSLHLFNNLPFRPTSVSWTSIISARSARSPSSSLSLFLSMLRSQTLPNQGTVSSLLKAFSPSSLSFCLQLHCLSFKLSLSCLPFSGSALISAYANSGICDDAVKAFGEIRDRDEVCYAALVVGLARNERPADAIRVFARMRRDGVPSTAHSVSGALRAAAGLAALEHTRALHAHAAAAGLDCGVVVGTALVDAYGKSGMVIDARRAFDGFADEANLVAWNATLAAYAQQGDAEGARLLFDEMAVGKGFAPDEFTFLAVLTACSNAGLVDDTARWLDTMRSHYSVRPRIEHYTCLVGAMSRVGRLDEAERFAISMPFEPDAAVWRTLLSGCMVHRSADLGRRIARRLIDLNPRDESGYVILANIYAATGRKHDMSEILIEMRSKGVGKERGISWVEVKGEVHEFVAGDTRHKRTMEIYSKVEELTKKATKLGFKEEEEEEGVWCHSERLAVAFAVVSGSAAAEGKEVRVVKNLRICGSCHEFFKYVSRVLEREIIVRDVNRYHRFVDGGCSCRDYW